MAVITASTFDPLKARCNVRLQQGVPIVDADWNELDDLRKFELRAYLKWFVGDGIPDGSDGFRIDVLPVVSSDDFIIRAGTPAAPAGAANYDIGLRNTGRAIVDGLDVIIQSDINYKSQPLFAGPGPGGVPQIQPIPVVGGPVVVYLDVWERLVTAQEDPSLVLRGLGTESCARMRREWAVRTRTGPDVPAPGDPDFLAGHSYCALATITRILITPTAAANIGQSNIVDRRHTKLTVSSLESRIAKIERLLVLPTFSAVGNQVLPRSGLVGATVELRGRNFDIGTPLVTIGNVVAALSPPFSSTSVKVIAPNLPAGGPYKVTITNDGGGPITADDQFSIIAGGGGGGALAPTFNPGAPFSSNSGGVGASIVLTGTNFDQPGLTVSFDATPAAVASATATQISVKVPAIAAGNHTITVTTTAGSIASPRPFTVV